MGWLESTFKMNTRGIQSLNFNYAYTNALFMSTELCLHDAPYIFLLVAHICIVSNEPTECQILV